MRVLMLSVLLTGFVELLQAQGITNRLAAYFPFETCEAKDASGNGATGALLGTPYCDCGVADSCLVFDTGDDAAYFVGSIADVFTTSDFTVSFYMKPEAPPTNIQNASQVVMTKQVDCDRNNVFWVRYRYKSPGSQLGNTVSAGISQNDTMLVNVSARLDNDRCWHHITLTRKGAELAIYVDGVLKDRKFSAVRLDITNPSGFRLSEPVCVTDTTYFGRLDELRFYTRAYEGPDIQKELGLNPDRVANKDTLIYLGNSFQASLTKTCATQFLWAPASGLSNATVPNPVITPTEPTAYVVTMVHPDGCRAKDTLFVNVIDPDTLDCDKIFIPNAFTPSATSGINDQFGISNPFAITEFTSFEIFDRWGGRMFNAASQFETWNGEFANRPVNPGAYLYRLRYKCKGVEKVRSGTLTLIR